MVRRDVDAPDRPARAVRADQTVRVGGRGGKEARDDARPARVRDVGDDDALAVPREVGVPAPDLGVVHAVGDVEAAEAVGVLAAAPLPQQLVRRA